MVEDAGAAELATDANKVGPVEPRTEVVLVEAAVADVDVTTNRKSIHLMPLQIHSNKQFQPISRVQFRKLFPEGTADSQSLEELFPKITSYLQVWLQKTEWVPSWYLWSVLPWVH